MAAIKRILLNSTQLQSALLITLNVIVLAGVIDISEEVVLGIDACIGAWLLLAQGLFTRDLAALNA